MPVIEIHRVGTAPIIHQGMDSSLGDNINGPSLVQVPDGTPNRLGRYYLYFAHHKGQFIRLAHADRLDGPWSLHAPGVLPLRATPFTRQKPDLPQPAWAIAQNTDGLYPHLASPDVRVRADGGFEMYVHGLMASGAQMSFRAVSEDGLDWRVVGEQIDETYMRVFDWRGETYAMARCSRMMRLGPDGWEPGPIAIAQEVRHVAVLVRGDVLHVVFTRIGDAPEHLLHAALPLDGDWQTWRASEVASILKPALSWEGADAPIQPSIIGAEGFSCALRDPCLWEDEHGCWLIYAGGAEHALGLAKVEGF